jgi:hypothetical protein
MATTYLSRTPSGAGNRKTFTISLWFKRSDITRRQALFNNTDGGGQNGVYYDLQADDTLLISDYGSGSFNWNLETTQVFRDVSAWYHLVISVDTTQSTASNRVKIYINGTQITNFDASNYPSQDSDTLWNRADTFEIGSYNGTGNYFEGSMSHIHFTDGTAYDASAFGETDATTGIWKPKTAPSVTYGTNGFFLKFENSGAFGTDSSGNGNNFTVNGTMTQNIDTPSNVFATLNPLQTDHSGNTAFSEGNNKFQATTADWVGTASTQGTNTGKWYAEFKLSTLTTAAMIGVATDVYLSSKGVTDYVGFTSGLPNYAYAKYLTGGVDANEGKIFQYDQTENTYGSNTGGSTGDIIGVALDLDNNKLYWSINGTWENSGDPAGNSNGYTIGAGTYQFGVWGYQSTSESNFGNGYFGTTAVSSAQNPDDGIGIFEYAVPTGYKALCTKSINAQGYD